MRSTAARRAEEAVLLGVEVVDVAGVGLSMMWSMSTSVVMDGSPVVWLEVIVWVLVCEETPLPLAELPGAGGRQGASELAAV